MAKSIKPKPYETATIKIPERLEFLKDKVGIEHTAEVIEFIGATFQAIKKSLSDGKIDPMDVINFIEPLTKVAGMVKSIPLVPEEVVYDELTDEEISKLMSVLISYGILPDDLVEAFEDHIKLARDIKALLFKYYIKK